MRRAFALGVAAYLVPTFPLGYAWHMVTFADRYHSLQLYRPDVIIPMGLTSMAIQAVAFSWAYPRLFDTRRDHWVGSAARAWFALTLVAWSYTTLPVAAKFEMTDVGLFVALETAFTALQSALVAPLLALAWRDPDV